MRKKLLCLLLAFALAFGMLAVTAYAEDEDTDDDTGFEETVENARAKAEKELRKYYFSLESRKYSDENWAQIELLYNQALQDVNTLEDGAEILKCYKRALSAMKKVEPEVITVTFRLIGDFFHEDGVNDHKEYVTWIPTVEYELKNGATMYDLFIQALTDYHLDQNGADIDYVDAIQAPTELGGYWLAERDNGGYSGWRCTVNGKDIGNVLRSHKLADNSKVIWHWTDDKPVEVDGKAVNGKTMRNLWLNADDISPLSYVKGHIDEIVTVSGRGKVETKIKNIGMGPQTTFTFIPEEGWQLSDVVVDGVSKGAEESFTYNYLTLASKIKVTFKRIPGQELPFEDISEGDWFYEDVEYAVRNGLFKGLSETEFGPDAAMTRAMLVTVLKRLDDKLAEDKEPETEEKETPANSFSDVADGAWYKEAVSWAAGKGIVKGTSKTEFSPDKSVSNEELVTIVYRYAKLAGADMKINTSLKAPENTSSFAKTAVRWAMSKGLLDYAGEDYAPTENAPRCDVASILHGLVVLLK